MPTLIAKHKCFLLTDSLKLTPMKIKTAELKD